MWRTPLALLVCCALVATPIALADQGNPIPTPTQGAGHVPPKKITIRRHFKPDATAAGSRLAWIAHEEQKRWGGPSLVGRMSCESGMNSRATNGTYDGALQFGPIWGSMWSGTPRGVTVRRHRTVKRKVLDAAGARVGTVRQHQTVIEHGRLPRNPSAFHAWAAVRVGQRAVSGHGPTTGWSCSL